MFHLADPFVAYCFDVAVARWGNAFEAAINAAGKGAKDQRSNDLAVERTVRRWLKTPRQPVGVGKQISG